MRITTIENWKLYKESINNISYDDAKKYSEMVKYLSQEVLQSPSGRNFLFDLIIDESFNIDPSLVKVREIYAQTVTLKMNKFPEWMKNVKIFGDLICSKNNMDTLENCPRFLDGSFYCNHNNLTSLAGGPQVSLNKGIIDYKCTYNKLTNLIGAPIEIKGVFHCAYNELTTLEGCPEKMDSLYCFNNQLTSLEYCPKELNDLACRENSVLLEKPTYVIIKNKFANT